MKRLNADRQRCCTNMTRRTFSGPLILAAIFLPGLASGGQPSGDEIVVTATKKPTPLLELTGNTARLSTDRIRMTGPQHIYELGTELAGTWLTRGSGQETLPAIRSPVLTGPGACGAFLILEDGLPIRPAGFCNVNDLFEVPVEISRSIEVVRGPSNALYGSSGLHGAMNILLPVPGSSPGWNAGVTVGPDQYYRGTFGWDGEVGGNALAAGLLADDYGGFRADSGYRQQKGFVRLDQPLSGGRLGWTFSAQHLDQDTAGFIHGKDAYKDATLRLGNENPDAFRKADSERLSVRWSPDPGSSGARTDMRLYLRHSAMHFLMHFLPGQPLEKNGQVSGGLMLGTVCRRGDATVTAGVDLEYMDGFIQQFQPQPATRPPFLAGKLPQGWQYNFAVSAIVTAPYAQINFPLATHWQLLAGLRLEYLHYRYDNKLADGNLRADGTPCPDGCRYNRPADRSDDFFNLAPNLGLLYHMNRQTTVYATLTRGFRAPQATELYRLQEQQDVADLKSTTLDSLELGMHRQTAHTMLEVSMFAMHKRHYIFQDADRNNISNGKSRHIGIEWQARVRAPASGWYGGAAGTWARHTYDFNAAARGETIESGNDIDTAPRTLGSLRIGRERGRGRIELEAVHQGSYWLDAANAHQYAGHDLLNLRARWRMAGDWTLTGRVNNLTDTRYADRADYAFGEYRYFPGRSREFFVEIGYRQ